MMCSRPYYLAGLQYPLDSVDLVLLQYCLVFFFFAINQILNENSPLQYSQERFY
jgi:hypothetical protein